MKTLNQDELERLKEQLRQGKITVGQANVLKVRMQRVMLVTAKVPREIRQTLNAAVKAGELGHVKKDGHKPEAYFHPEFEYMVAGARNAHARKVLDAVAKVMA